MNSHFADTLGIQIIEKPFLDEKSFPIFRRNEYDILQVEVENVPCLILKKREIWTSHKWKSIANV